MIGFVDWLKFHKTKLIVSALIIIALMVLYYLFFPTLLWLNCNQTGVKLEMNGRSAGTLNKTKIMFLKPGIYTFRASKDGFLEYNDLINIGKTKITKRNIVLSKMYYVSATPSQDILGASFLNYSADGKSLISFANNDFYKIPLGNNGYIVADYKAEKMGIDLGLAEGDQVLNVKYSPDKNKALVLVKNENSKVVKAVSLADNKIIATLNLFDADWLTNEEVAGISATDQKILVKQGLAGGQSEIIKSTTDFLDITADSEGKFVLGVAQDKATIINLQNNSPKEIDFAEEMIFKTLGLSNGQFITNTTSKTYLVSANSQKTNLKISPYFGSIALANTDTLIFATFNARAKTYDFITYSLKTKNTKTVNTLSQERGDPSDLIANKEFVNYVVNGSIMGFKIE